MGKKTDSNNELMEVQENVECELDISHLTGISNIDQYIENELYTKPYLKINESSLAFSNIISKVGRKFKVDTNDIDEMENRFNAYLDMCEACNHIPTEVEFAMFMGVCRATLWSWISGDRRSADSRYVDTVKKWKQYFENILTERAYFANNPAGAIFLLKNNHGYTDKQEISIEPKNPIGDTMTPEEIAASMPDRLPDHKHN